MELDTSDGDSVKWVAITTDKELQDALLEMWTRGKGFELLKLEAVNGERL